MKVALVCIAKNEDFYIEEWLAYNKKLGFNDIFMYENDWKCPIDLPYLHKIEFNGPIKQLQAYNDFIRGNKSNYNYAAFFDCDEFLVLKKHNNIQEFVIECGNNTGIGINWQMYGSCGIRERGEHKNSLIKQFIKRENGPNQHIKAIVNLKSNPIMVSPHHPNLPLMDTRKKTFHGPFNPNGPIDVAVLNHYHHKTLEDWRNRIVRGYADANRIITERNWEHDVNKYADVIDYSAFNFMYSE